MNKTGYFTHADCWKHEMGPGHPECPERLDAIEKQLQTSDVLEWLDRREAPLEEYPELVSLRDTGEENYYHFYNDVLAKLLPRRILSADPPPLRANPGSLRAATMPAPAGRIAAEVGLPAPGTMPPVLAAGARGAVAVAVSAAAGCATVCAGRCGGTLDGRPATSRTPSGVMTPSGVGRIIPAESNW